MQKYPEQAFVCKVICNIHTFVPCKMHITMCTLQANYVKVVTCKQKKIHYIHLYAENCAQLVYKVGCLCDLQNVCVTGPLLPVTWRAWLAQQAEA